LGVSIWKPGEANSDLAAASGTVMSTGLALRASSVTVVLLVTFSFGWTSQSVPLVTSSGSTKVVVLRT
jgi:hypothetical protein